MFPVSLAALSVRGETAHIWETQLCRDVGGSARGYVPGIRKEPAVAANRAELYGVPQAVGVTPSPINVTSVLVVKEEVALELSLFDLADVATVRGGLVVVEEVCRLPAMVSNSRSLPFSVRFRSIVPQPPSRQNRHSDRAVFTSRRWDSTKHTVPELPSVPTGTTCSSATSIAQMNSLR